MRTWPHAPSKCVTDPGTYFVTAATYQKKALFRGKQRLDLLHDRLLAMAEELGWDLMAWAVFPNHYHWVGISPDTKNAVGVLCGKTHRQSAIELNALDGTPGRQVWYRSWDVRVTYEKSLLARMAYTMENPVRHGLVKAARDYPWCSAAWLEREGDRPFVESVRSFKTDKVNVYDEFEVSPDDC